PSQAWADRESDLDHFIEGRLIAGRAEGAVIGLLVHGLERLCGVEHPTTTGAQNVPSQLEQPQPCSVQEPTDGFFLAQLVFAGEVHDIDTAQLPMPSRTTDSMAATTFWSADLRRVSKSAFVSLIELT